LADTPVKKAGWVVVELLVVDLLVVDLLVVDVLVVVAHAALCGDWQGFHAEEVHPELDLLPTVEVT
jgi:hypothetical protein